MLSLSTQGGDWVVTLGWLEGIAIKKKWQTEGPVGEDIWRFLISPPSFYTYCRITVDIIYRECVDQCLTCKLGSGSDTLGRFFFHTRPKSPFTDWVKETKCGP